MIQQVLALSLRPTDRNGYPATARWGVVLFLALAATGRLSAQSQVCPPGTPAFSVCDSACVHCNFSGAWGTTIAGGSSLATACGLLQNARWTGFMASSKTATFEVTPLNCSAGKGIKAAVYSRCDSLPIACNTGTGSVESVTLANVPLIIGHRYFLVVAGYNADVCDFTASCTPPMIPVTPGPARSILGPTKLCPKESAVYSTAPVPGADIIVWNGPPGSFINGQTPPVTLDARKGGTTVTVKFGHVGGAISAQTVNACRTGPVSSRTVTVAPIPPTYQLPRKTVCQDSFLMGNYPKDTIYITDDGCDSLVIRRPMVLPSYTIGPILRYVCSDNPTFKICDSVFVGPNPDIVRNCKTFLGCDSIIKIDLRVLDPVAKIIRTGNNTLLCANTPLILRSQPSPNPTVKRWFNMAGGLLGQGDTLHVTRPGQYVLESKMTVQAVPCIKRDTIQVGVAPSSVQVSGTVSPTCLGQKTGTAVVTANSGTPPYTYVWSNNQAGAVLNNVGKGTYTVTVKDGNGCTAQLSATVPAIPAFTVQLQTVTEPAGNTCQSTAVASLGVPPYSFRWSNGQTGAVATQLPGGPFNVRVKDATGCISFKTGSCSVSNARAASGVSISPNPANTHVAVYAHIPFSEKWQVSLVSPMGQTLFEQTYEGDLLEDRIDLLDYPVGCYLLRLSTPSGYRHAQVVAVVR